MAPETSQFESSELLGAFLASSPLLEESWRLCSHANAHAHRSFAVNAVGPVTYVAHSAVQAVVRSQDHMPMVELDENVFGSFSRLHMVDAALLHLFLSFYACFHFRQKMEEVMKQSKSIVFCGHSVGGAVASLSSLWLLSYIRRAPPPHPISVFCITYGSPLLGNQAFSHAILQERWAANFCHVVAPHDVVPRLLSDQERWPFGSYVFCTDKGALCLDNASAIVKFLYLTMAEYSSTDDDHLMYGNYVSKLCWQYLKKRSILLLTSESDDIHDSNNEAGVALALQTLGITTHQEAAYEALVKARQMGWRRNLNNAKMAVSLAKINPCRAELEWYKKYCDDSDDQLGYYDSFKRRGASRREFRVTMNRIKLARFWDDLIEKLETNQLTHDFHRMSKYVNASHFYNLLVEPLEIAEYYRTGKHREKGHYIEHGREKRFKVFDKWWGERKFGDEESKPRSKYASLTQDSCFWARVEEAICLIYDVVAETDVGRRLMLVEKIDKFEQYAGGMIERMEVSVDVLAQNSSYNLFRQEWGDLRASGGSSRKC